MKPHPLDLRAKVLFHRRVSSDFFRLQLLCPEIARQARPGQFLMLRINELRDPFLRRPFSFSRIFPPRQKGKQPRDEGRIEIIYQVVGRGTSLLTQVQEGQRVDILGPLGKGFERVGGQERVILVGGGIGMAPLLSWAEELTQKGPKKKRAAKNPGSRPETLILIGGRSEETVLGIAECRRMGVEPQVATEDGSLGVQGLVTDLLERELLTGQNTPAALYACGPMPMLSRVAQMSDQFDLPCQVLIESRMACGVGACLGCTVRVREEKPRKMKNGKETSWGTEEVSAQFGEGECGAESYEEGMIPGITEVPPFRYARVCKEGPVFDARKIFWE